ncbi:unnamed protein product [Adineta steineri]|uniref:Uncharacterized protein n=1 Tax=Adineta steineri TaxID=433720 RepID=A0A816GU38_9BILA|nr:unnamed protein product [Adineta steineri]CAF1677587.1 unnamed protein product [Adineta steineri]
MKTFLQPLRLPSLSSSNYASPPSNPPFSPSQMFSDCPVAETPCFASPSACQQINELSRPRRIIKSVRRLWFIRWSKKTINEAETTTTRKQKKIKQLVGTQMKR